MRSIGLLFPLVLICAAVFAVMYGRSSAAARRERGVEPEAPRATPTTVPRGLADDLSRWVAAGLLTDDQRAAILDHERAAEAPAAPPAVPAAVPAAAPGAPVRRRGIPVVAEALGYLGGILTISGLGLVVSRYWPDMATAGRLALSGTAAVALLGAGALAREQADPALARLRWFLWLAATAATALFAGVVTFDGLETARETVTLACAGSVALLSGLLWRGRDRPLQQLTCLAGVAVAAGALIAEIGTGGPIGLAVWVVGAAYVALGLRRITTLPALTEGLGALAVVVAGFIVTVDWESFGILFLVATAFGLLGLATVPDLAPERTDRRVLGVVGGLALLQGAPQAIGWFSQDAAGPTGLVTWAIGGLLLLAGVRRLTRLPVQTELLGGAGLMVGAAVTGAQWESFAPLFGIATGVGLVGLGMLPGQVLLSVLGSVALLVNVPWAIGIFFPGEGRAPLLIMVSGAMIIAIAVLLTRMGGRLRRDLGSARRPRPPRGGMIPGASH